MPDALAHASAMLVIRNNAMPRLWWLVPWAYARQLHRNACALRDLCDRLDAAVELQNRIIEDQSAEIANLRRREREASVR